MGANQSHQARPGNVTLSMVNATDATNELCPFCGKAIPADTSSRDHVFGDAFGGIKVPNILESACVGPLQRGRHHVLCLFTDCIAANREGGMN